MPRSPDSYRDCLGMTSFTPSHSLFRSFTLSLFIIHCSLFVEKTLSLFHFSRDKSRLYYSLKDYFTNITL